MDFIPYGSQWIDEDDISDVIEVLKSDWITTGPKISEFESELAKYVGSQHCVVVNSGTSALDIAVGSLELPKGSEIITTPFTFVATSNSILYNGLNPVFADIKADTFNIDPEDVRKKITEKTKAIIYVDYAGQPCDINELRAIANEFGLYLIEDACHAIGAEYEGKRIGTFSDLTVFSFHPVKHITTGEGGAVVTNNSDLYQKMCLLRNHGIDRDGEERYGPFASWAYDMKCLGRNYRMTDIQAALGISQLKKLDGFVSKRDEIASKYMQILADIDFIQLPTVKKNIKHAWHLYTILLDGSMDRDDFFQYMRSKNVGVNLHYIPAYKHTYYVENLNFKDSDYPVTEDVFKRIITLPLFPKMKEEQLEYIVNIIEGYKDEHQ